MVKQNTNDNMYYIKYNIWLYIANPQEVSFFTIRGDIWNWNFENNAWLRKWETAWSNKATIYK